MKKLAAFSIASIGACSPFPRNWNNPPQPKNEGRLAG
jgi:hypothetical protein